jgi:flagellar biosynthesis/type III secretory pathway chaperone
MNMMQLHTSQYTELSPLLDSLIDLLKREIAVYRELQATITQEKVILLKPSLDRILESNSRKETVLLKAKMLEEGRFKIVKKIARMLDLEEREINLTLLISYADCDQEKDLRECQSILHGLVAKNREMNQNNKGLIDYSLQFLQGSVDFIHSIMSSASACYMPSGKMRPIARNGNIVKTRG